MGPLPERPYPIPQTTRLELRELTWADVDDLVRLDSDPAVMHYIADGRTAKRADIEAAMPRILRTYALWPGLGSWRAARRDTGTFIGWFTFKYVPKTVEIEVGYRLLREAWGQGFATEGAVACVRHGFETLGLDRIIGITHPGNLASQRVLQKAGLRDAGFGRYYDSKVRLFVATNPAR